MTMKQEIKRDKALTLAKSLIDVIYQMLDEIDEGESTDDKRLELNSLRLQLPSLFEEINK